jgi:hypothetical protein
MDHGFMIGMLLGGALVALVPTGLLVGVCVYALRQRRAQRQHESTGAHPMEAGK